MLTRGGRRGQKSENFADIICERSLSLDTLAPLCSLLTIYVFAVRMYIQPNLTASWGIQQSTPDMSMSFSHFPVNVRWQLILFTISSWVIWIVFVVEDCMHGGGIIFGLPNVLRKKCLSEFNERWIF